MVVGSLMLCCMCCVPRPGSKAAESAGEFVADCAKTFLPPDLASYVFGPGGTSTQYKRMQQQQQKEVDL